ncbi:xanthine dehydrogenase family protein molybdopterin-binding subunit [Steroidobacter agaridevorans]|uniref:xanthine dehydrogenase family protein molybdopterin-binding subunit n=1 Tax=Steroidobacter agaridevorans TaxID=2695856 RepID=UPI00132C7C5A|nr:molybdopterin cofactor-binding domain-containing protein [Steroidobacter agaridevorans]GFE87627.1 isoquinoline 1-oxidoreductase subunit beta [Steroidobacter agaridevorans]
MSHRLNRNAPHDTTPESSTTRRRFLQYTLGGSATLVLGGAFVGADDAEASVSLPELGEILDFADVIRLAETPYANNLVLEVTADNRVRFELPRLDKGQGIATAFAMLVADELDADYARTDVVLSDRRADRPFSITGNSAAIRALWGPVRSLSAQARARLVTAAARRWNVSASSLRTSQSKVIATDGRSATYGELSADAALVLVPLISVTPKSISQYKVVGTARPRKNARDIVTGAQKYTLDVDVPGAMPTVVARAPDIKGAVLSWNGSVASSMPGVLGIVPLPNGIAVTARTFKQAFDARDALQITWRPGPVRGLSDANVRSTLQQINTPLTPVLPLVGSLTATYEFPYLAHAMMEVMAAVADVRGQSAEIWYASQSPNYIAAEIAQAIGIPASKVKIHVPFAGGSFGRRLFGEVAIEAALVSKALGRPVKLMWTRNDDMRHGRFRPMSRCAIRASWLAGATLSFEHHVAAARNDFRHGLGDALSAAGVNVVPDLFNQVGFVTMISLPYRFGSTSTKLVEREFNVPTGSWRSVYSGVMTAANEIFIDEMARARGYDEVDFRLRHLDSAAAERCLRHVASAGSWGRAMPPGHAQGIAIHAEYRSAVAYLVEIDTTGPEPRLSKAYCAVDVGVPVNVSGLSAQMQGSLIDAWSSMFRAGNHLDDGRIREGSFGDFLWSRMNHSPITTEVHVFPAEAGAQPGGAGELGITAAAAACVNAYARATGTRPRRFPIQEFA